MEVGNEKEGRDEESKDVTESPGAMSSENSAAIKNLNPENPKRLRSTRVKKRILRLGRKSKMANPRML